MNFKDLTDNLLKSEKDDDCKHLLNFEIPDISLPNQSGNFLNLHRSDSFRIVIYCFPMTGRPDRSLPKNCSTNETLIYGVVKYVYNISASSCDKLPLKSSRICSCNISSSVTPLKYSSF